MKRSTFSVLSVSAFSALIAIGAIAPTAQALPQPTAGFNLQSLRLRELDARNKSGDYAQAGYPQPDYSESSYSQPVNSQSPVQPAVPTVSTEADSTQTTEPTAGEAPDSEKETASSEISVAQRRQQFLDSRN